MDSVFNALDRLKQNPAEDFGSLLRLWRKVAGLRLDDLARSSGVGKNAIWMIENDKTMSKDKKRKRKVKEETKRKLLAALKTAEPLTPPDKVRELLHKLRLTQEKFAQEAGVDSETVRNLENGRPCALLLHLKVHAALKLLAEPLIPPNKVRAVRCALGLTQEGAARKAGVKRETFWNLENDRPCARALHLKVHEAFRRLAEEMDRTLQDLIEEGAHEIRLCEWIRQQREALGWSLPELARRAGIAEGTLRLIENGDHAAWPRTRRAIEQALEDGRNGIAKVNGHKNARLYAAFSKSVKAHRRKQDARLISSEAGKAILALVGADWIATRAIYEHLKGQPFLPKDRSSACGLIKRALLAAFRLRMVEKKLKKEVETVRGRPQRYHWRRVQNNSAPAPSESVPLRPNGEDGAVTEQPREETPQELKPRWDPDRRRRQLSWGNRCLKKFGKQSARSQISLIEAFQAANWEHSIANPFTYPGPDGQPLPDPEKLRQVCRNLNRTLPARTIRFRPSSTGERAIWVES